MLFIPSFASFLLIGGGVINENKYKKEINKLIIDYHIKFYYGSVCYMMRGRKKIQNNDDWWIINNTQK